MTKETLALLFPLLALFPRTLGVTPSRPVAGHHLRLLLNPEALPLRLPEDMLQNVVPHLSELAGRILGGAVFYGPREHLGLGGPCLLP